MFVKYIGKNIKNLSKDNIYNVLKVIENYYFLINDNENIETIFEPNLFVIIPILKVKYIGNCEKTSFVKNKIYDVLSIETSFEKDDSYRIIDESEESYLYNKNSFEIIENNMEKIYEKLK